MRPEALDALVCPACSGALRSSVAPGNDLTEGELLCTGCDRRWPVGGGIPDLIFPRALAEGDAASRALWERIGRFYDWIGPLTNVMRGVSGSSERRTLIDRLDLSPDSVALEVAAGTGENLVAIAGRIGAEGAVFGVDLSPRMLRQAAPKLGKAGLSATLVLGNAARLPFRDGTFDSVLDGFGMKYYPDKGRAIREMLRVVKPGGKVVIAELGLPQNALLGIRQRMLRAWIPHFDEPPPLDAIPGSARSLSVSWDAHSTAYTIEFCRPSA